MTAREDPLWVVVGPTASGKTELAHELARRAGGELVSADSVQIYRYFDIGSGKPSTSERALVPYHLIDCVEPEQAMDAGRFAELALSAVREITARGRRPIVVGGTFLWVRALIYGLAPAPPADPALRARHRERAAIEGRQALHDELARVDPESAARLAPNDFVRVSRALEVQELSGVPLSRWQTGHGFRAPRLAVRLIGVTREKEELDQRIQRRIEQMFELGLVDEVQALLDRGFGDTRAMQAVGYRQVAAALRAGGSIDRGGLIESIYRATRTFVRRQRTWLRDRPVEWVADAEAILRGS
jgi:tRNA dimethylallyltransferase